MTDDEFIAAFEDRAIAREDWTHEAHVRMGWIYARRACHEQGLRKVGCSLPRVGDPCHRRGLPRTTGEVPTGVIVDKVREGLRQLSLANKGNADLYHETVTVAFVEIILHRAQAPGAAEDWPGFREAHPELFDRERSVLLDHYRQETLDSDRAKSSFVPPDFAPFSAEAKAAP